MRAAVAAVAALAWVSCSPAGLGAAALGHPMRVPVIGGPALPHRDVTITTADGLALSGWLFPAAPARGLVVLVHGKDTNRLHLAGAVGRLHARGYAVLAYDQRAHGRSQGDVTTYGVKESEDLSRAVDVALGAEPLADLPLYLVGESLGAATVLQEAAKDVRVRGVVAGASFSDLRTIAAEHTPFFFSDGTRDEALTQVAKEGRFDVDAASPVKAAPRIEAPVLLLHGSEDTFIPMAHSLRIYEALHAPRRFVRLEGVSHPDILQHDEAWAAIEQFFDDVEAGRVTAHW